MDKEKLQMIGLNPPILSSVMAHLSARELNACSQVCQLWHTIATCEKKRRTQICWFSYNHCVLAKIHKTPCLNYSEGNTSCSILFREFMHNLPINPKTTLIFCTKSLISHPEIHFQPRIKSLKRKFDADNENYRLDQSALRYPVIGSLLPYFPRHCEIGFCTAIGTVTTSEDNADMREIEICPSLGAVFFPEIEGFEIHKFIMSGFGFDITKDMTVEEMTGIPAGSPVKCLLIFLYDRVGSHRSQPSHKIISHYVDGQNCEVALGGAFISHMFFPRHKARRRNQSYGIAFTGDNVRAASVLIRPTDETRDDVILRLKPLAEQNLLDGQCIAFMFACVARGQGLYNEYNVESSVFKSMFPSVPLFGVFGQGEIGMNYIPGIAPKVKKCNIFSWYRNYTTVFVLISIKK